MAHENADLVERLWRSYELNGAEGALPFLTEDVRWHTFPDAVGQSLYEGHEGQAALQGDMDEWLDEFRIRPIEFRDAGDRVVVLVEMSGKIRGTDTLMSQRIGITYGDFRAGRIGEVRTHQTWDEALDAAGIGS